MGTCRLGCPALCTTPTAPRLPFMRRQSGPCVSHRKRPRARRLLSLALGCAVPGSVLAKTGRNRTYLTGGPRTGNVLHDRRCRVGGLRHLPAVATKGGWVLGSANRHEVGLPFPTVWTSNADVFTHESMPRFESDSSACMTGNDCSLRSTRKNMHKCARPID